MQSCTNDMTNRNMWTVTISSFFTKLETDVSMFSPSVCCVSTYGNLFISGQQLGSLSVSVTAVSEQ